MVDPIERAVRDVTRNVWPPLRDFLQLAVFLVWTGAWAAVAGLGWLFSFDPMRIAGLVMVALSIIGAITARAMRKRRLAREARTSLVARARLERLRLTPEAESVLSAFDITHRNVRELLAEPAIAGVALSGSIARDVDGAGEQLFALVQREVRLERDLRELNRLETTRSVTSSRDEVREQIRGLRAEQETITTNARRLAERLKNVRELSGASAPAGEPQRVALEELLDDLDRTASAYREINDSELKTREERARARMRARASEPAK